MTSPSTAERYRSLREGNFVKRWHAERTLQEDMVGQHTAQMLVAGYIILGDERMTPQLVKAITFHDAGHEKFVGDWPWGAKGPLSAGKARELEHHLATKFRLILGVHTPLTSQEAEDLAFLDLFEATMYACDEVRMGNEFMMEKMGACVHFLSKFPQMDPNGPIFTLVQEILTGSNSDGHKWLKEMLFA